MCIRDRFGFFWGVPGVNGTVKTQHTTAVVTVAMAVYVFRYQIYNIRSASRFIIQHGFDVQVVAAVVVGLWY